MEKVKVGDKIRVRIKTDDGWRLVDAIVAKIWGDESGSTSNPAGCFAIEYLGKEVLGGMIVGYDKDGGKHIIISYTDHKGWSPKSLEKDDVILINSPLNVSFSYVPLRRLTEEELI